MKTAFLFTGQGSQTVGMGKDIYEKYETARKVFDKASEISGIDVKNICFNGPEEELNKTENTQIAILTTSLALLKILEENGKKAEIAVGLSLGEYAALIYGGYITFEDGIKLIQKRGYYMGNFLPEEEYSMAAIIGLEDEKVEKACKSVKNGFVRAVNYNCPGQVVVSGDKDAVIESMEIAKELGARKTIELKTSGPFHTEKLKNASIELRKELEKITFNKCNIPVIKNFDGSAYSENDNMVEVLANHVINPVKFRKSIEIMLEMGADTFVEVGPGKTLSGFVRKVAKEKQKEVVVLNVENVETMENVLQIIQNKEC